MGLITNIGRAHIGEFGGAENIRKGKTELFRFLESVHGMALVDASSQVLMEESSALQRSTYGPSGSDVPVHLVGADPTLSLEWRSHRLRTALVGAYNLNNAAAAICAGLEFGISEDNIVQALIGYRPDNNRSQLTRIGQLEIIQDAYNANPDSMEAALANFSSMSAGRKFFVLGDMLELGDQELDFHRQIIGQALATGADGIFVGPRFQAAAHENPEAVSCKDVHAAAQLIRGLDLQEGLVLIKGSRAMALERLLDTWSSILEDTP